MASTVPQSSHIKSKLMRDFLKKIVNNDQRAKQLFRLYFDRKELSEDQFYKAISS
jgi:hypothetical protein